MKVIIDRDVCSGHGRCYTLAPNVFESDEEGYGVVRVAEVPDELVAEARSGQANCPEQAIRLLD